MRYVINGPVSYHLTGDVKLTANSITPNLLPLPQFLVFVILGLLIESTLLGYRAFRFPRHVFFKGLS